MGWGLGWRVGAKVEINANSAGPTKLKLDCACLGLAINGDNALKTVNPIIIRETSGENDYSSQFYLDTTHKTNRYIIF